MSYIIIVYSFVRLNFAESRFAVRMNDPLRGRSVKIQRSDGRVHKALVSGVNEENKFISVEWFENGETKGKSVTFADLLCFNPDICRACEITGSHPLYKMWQVVNGTEPINKETAPKSEELSTVGTSSPVLDHLSELSVARRKSALPNQTVIEGNCRLMLDTTVRSSRPAGARASRGANPCDSNASWTFRDELHVKGHKKDHSKLDQFLVDHGSEANKLFVMIQEYRKKLEFRPLSVFDTVRESRISVCVRKRPLNDKEMGRQEIDVITIPNRDHIILHQPQTKVDLTKYLENQTFRFDYAFDETATNEMVYKFTAQPLVETIFNGGTATCFAYGQTGSGKTHTMGGQFAGRNQEVNYGIYAFTARDVFRLASSQYKHLQVSIFCSFFEIYSGKVFDLLSSKAKLRILEDSHGQVQVVGLREVKVTDRNEILSLIRCGTEVRTSGQTSANSMSSRSHAIFQFILRKKNSDKVYGRFSLIDLAGNERGADTMAADRQTRLESAEINRSLLALKECIRALGRKNAHLPFRGSKLTLVLRDSFVGQNARTCMIAMVSPGSASCEHSLNTLRYADRVKELVTESPTLLAKDETLEAISEEDSLSYCDLAHIQSQNEGEMDKGFLSMHMAVERLQMAEERLTEEHGKACKSFLEWLPTFEALYKASQTVDCDTEAYATGVLNHVLSLRDQLSCLEEKAKNCLEQLNEERKLAQNARCEH
uniref:Kinesin-like protein n=1 Tax=Trichuris muris TaxID=70415 RepID=A0A5S6Q861_TRIMR